ncbi:MAG: thioredoxin family protein [Candidatus Omnitrophica bacterium]|nr:thioredoxin family protein [Candidatus Omnitrophota bacterium]
MKKLAILVSFLLVMGCTQPQAQVSEGDFTWIRDINIALDTAKTENKPILIDFYTEWCGWCKKLDKDTYANLEVQEGLKQFVCVKIDAEKNKDLAKQYKINGFPSTAFLKSSGQLIEVVPGYLPPKDFLKLLDRMLLSSK